jgi:DNA-binding SARP family transcriptional activator/tetratricopeptide (TPR) repeat protein
MDFRILGPLEVWHDSRLVSLGGPRQQTGMAMLLLEANRVMTVDRLVSALWDEEPPATARSQLQICISKLRHQIAVDDPAQQRIVRSPAGYMLRLKGDRLDSDDFGAKVAAAQRALVAGDLARARQEFRCGLALWRGTALAGIDSRHVRQSAMLLDERQLVVTEECLDCELRLGLYRDSVAELTALVTDHPLRERFHALLMLALYGAERQAEALDAYRRARKALVEELGIEPGAALQQLHERILAGVSVRELLGQADPQPAAVSAVIPPTIDQPADGHVPRLLVADGPDFTGRVSLVERIVADITAAASGAAAEHAAVPVTMIIGRGGVGKTTLAVHVAHKVAERFPDGQLFACLRINDRPVDPADILEGFLQALGVSGSVLPDSAAKRAEIYRDKLAGRRVLIVLDDAVSEQQISALLPGSALCSVIVTSRRRLTGIAVTNRFELGSFSHDSAVELLTKIVSPERIMAEPAAVKALCSQCDYLPLALRIVGARLAARPHWSVAELVDRLADESRRLDELHHGNMGVRASIALTHNDLSADARVLFRRLAIFDVPSFGYWVSAPLMDTTVQAGKEFMEELTEAYLIDADAHPAGETRYRFHDITRLFARERLVMDESAQDRHAALERLLGAVLHLVGAAHQREYSGDFLLLHGGGSRWPLPGWLIDRILKDPLDWYQHERPSIVTSVRQAAASGMTELAWELALSSVALFESHSHFTDWRETHERALEACSRAGNQRGEAAMRYSLGSLHMFRRRPKQATRELASASELFEQLGDQYGVALVKRNQAYLDRISGDLDQALSRWAQALRTFQAAGDLIGEAHILHNVAQVLLDRGDEAAAAGLLERARKICVDLRNRRVGAQVYHRLGDLHLRRGELDAAAAAFDEALAAVRESNDQVGEGYALLGLGTVHLRWNDPPTAVGVLAEAESIARTLGERMLLGRVGLAQAELLLGQGQLGAAAEYIDQAIEEFGFMEAHLLKAEALIKRGEIHIAAGNPREARESREAGLATLSLVSDHADRGVVHELRRRTRGLGFDADVVLLNRGPRADRHWAPPACPPPNPTGMQRLRQVAAGRHSPASAASGHQPAGLPVLEGPPATAPAPGVVVVPRAVPRAMASCAGAVLATIAPVIAEVAPGRWRRRAKAAQQPSQKRTLRRETQHG